MSDRFKATIAAVSQARDEAARRVVEAFPDGRGLRAATLEELAALGCTPAQAKRIQSALELAAEIERVRRRKWEPAITGPAALDRYIRDHIDIADLQTEHFWVVLLNSRQRPIIEPRMVGLGTVSQVEVHPREVFRSAIRLGATFVVLAHNHPSGDAEPSAADLDLTRRMVECGLLLGVPVVDHIIVTEDDALSMAALGLLG